MSNAPHIKYRSIADQTRSLLDLSNAEIAERLNCHIATVQTARREIVGPTRPARPGGWTDERVDALARLWADGHSASRIAARLGGFERCRDGGRSAVIGKVHRLGLASRATATRTAHPTRKHPISREAANRRWNGAPKPKPSPLKALYMVADGYVPPTEELAIPLNERKTVQTLTEICCRWPIGDPQQPEFHFCGKKKIPGLPYCEVHARRAYQPPQARRREPVLHVVGTEEVAA